MSDGPSPTPPQPKPQNAVTIAVSSRALFRMDEEQRIYAEQGVEEYVRYQLEHENEPFSPGPAFPFVKVRGSPTTSHTVPLCLSRGKGSSGLMPPGRSRACLGDQATVGRRARPILSTNAAPRHGTILVNGSGAGFQPPLTLSVRQP